MNVKNLILYCVLAVCVTAIWVCPFYWSYKRDCAFITGGYERGTLQGSGYVE